VTRLVDEDMGEMAELEVRFLEEGSGTASGDEHALGAHMGDGVEACSRIVAGSGQGKIMRHTRRQRKTDNKVMSSANGG
jgi:hypothetical protein